MKIKAHQAHLLMYDLDGRILLQQRDDLRDVPKIKNPGKWGLFGGSFDDRESRLDCLKREVLEELSITLEAKPTCIKKIQLSEKYFNYIHLFALRTNKKQLCQHEGQGRGWFNATEVFLLNLAKEDRAFFGWFFHAYSFKRNRYVKKIKVTGTKTGN